jgi:hypothetical protein
LRQVGIEKDQRSAGFREPIAIQSSLGEARFTTSSIPIKPAPAATQIDNSPDLGQALSNADVATA